MDVETRRVLIVDDDDDLRHALSYLLSDAGYTVDEAPDGRRALERLHASRDGMVVLLDLRMPVLDGVEVMRAVVAHEYLARRHAYILMTADHEWFPPLFLTVLDELKVPILAKPFDIFRTLDVVRLAEQRLKTGT
jgi:CheY-like chemotaxis protein